MMIGLLLLLSFQNFTFKSMESCVYPYSDLLLSEFHVVGIDTNINSIYSFHFRWHPSVLFDKDAPMSPCSSRRSRIISWLMVQSFTRDLHREVTWNHPLFRTSITTSQQKAQNCINHYPGKKESNGVFDTGCEYQLRERTYLGNMLFGDSVGSLATSRFCFLLTWAPGLGMTWNANLKN